MHANSIIGKIIKTVCDDMGPGVSKHVGKVMPGVCLGDVRQPGRPARCVMLSSAE